MTDPPTLAPLITMSESRLRAIKSRVPIQYDMSKQRIVDLLAELEAQRRARVQEAASVRRDALDEAIRVVRAGDIAGHTVVNAVIPAIVDQLERLRDQPAEDKATAAMRGADPMVEKDERHE